MRIGIDGTILEAGRRTGVGRYLQNLVTEWSEQPRGHEFLVYHSRLEPPDAALRRPPFRLRPLLPIPFVQSYTHPQRLLWEQVALPLAAERDGIELLFSPGYTAPLRSPCPGVVTIHDISFSVHPEWYAPVARWTLAAVARAAARRRQAVLTDSQFSRNEIVRAYRVAPERVRAIYLAGDPLFTAGGKADEGLPANVPSPPERLVLFVGTMYRRRRVACLVRAFDTLASRLPAVRLVLVGADPDGEAVKSLAQIRACERVTVLGHVTEETLRALYAACAAFVYLSEYEGFGLPVIEAMACGAPVITSHTASLPEVAGDAALFVPLDDEAALVEALHAVLTDGDRAAELRQKGRRRAEQFRWDRCAAQTLDVLEGAAQQSAPGPQSLPAMGAER